MVDDFIKSNNDKRLKYADTFQSIFGVSLGKYWDIITGFDIIKFDKEFMRTPDGVSLAEFIKQKYGDAGVSVIKELL